MRRYDFLCFVLGVLGLACIVSAAPGVDHRPAFDKTGYGDRIWTQVNAHWPPNKPRLHGKGGPNYATRDYGDELWGRAAAHTAAYGLTGWQFELHVPAPGYGNTFKRVLNEVQRHAPQVQLSIFLVYYNVGDTQAEIQRTIRQFEMFREELKSHPNVYRLHGRPVISVYTPHRFKPEQWGEIIPAVEAEFGPFVWLFNVGDNASDTDIDRIRTYLPYFDGVSQYVNTTRQRHTLLHAALGELMHKEYPQKIFEAGVHNAYSNHFHFGGVATYLSQKYRQSWDTALAAKADSVVITNYYDHYENSLIIPCYEREDFMLRYAEYRFAAWKGQAFASKSKPELVLTNYTNLRLGERPVAFEVFAFPLDHASKQVSLTLEICDTAGQVIHRFPEQQVTLDKLHILEFSLPSEDFADHRAIVPRLTYRWQSREYASQYNPPTHLSPSLRSYRMFWARSTANAIEDPARTDPQWTMGGQRPGGVMTYPASRQALLKMNIKSMSGDGIQGRRPGLFRLMRNGLELTHAPRYDLSLSWALPLPQPAGGMDYYHVEYENALGHRFQTLPIWVSDGSRPGKVDMPIEAGDSVRTVSIDAERVPFFYYPCDVDTDNLLLDASGYQHNGALKFEAYGGGHLGYTGYYYLHNGPVAYREQTVLATDETGQSFYRLNGSQAFVVMGGSVFPGASTYEIAVRPRALGAKQGIFGSGNRAITLWITPEGKVKASRSQAQGRPVEITSNTTVAAGQWHRLAIVYDLRSMKLYVDGKLEGQANVAPAQAHQSMNTMIVGALCKGIWDPVEFFDGDIRQVRFYGRNLTPAEFLP